MNKILSFEAIFDRLGNRYLLAAIAAAQTIALLGAIPGYLSIYLYARLNNESAAQLTGMTTFLLIVSLTALFVIAWQITPKARKRLAAYVAGSTTAEPADEYAAWHEITSLTWRYGIASFAIPFIVVVLPLSVIAYLSNNIFISPANGSPVSSPAALYIFLGGTAAVLGSSILAIFLTGRFTLPIRLILVPTNIETQLKARAGALVGGKFLLLIPSLMLISLLLLAPVGYEQIVRVIRAEATPMDVFGDLQVHTVLFSALALILGVVVSYYVSRSVTEPVQELIEIFDKIERGDLSARARISATDELGVVTIQFNRMVARLESLQTRLEQQVAERTKQLTASSEVGRVASSSLDPDEMIARVVHLFTDQFGYRFAAIYLLDQSEKWAELKDATGEMGTRLKQAHHRIETAGRKLVSVAIRERSPRTAHAVLDDKRRTDNTLGEASSEIALPLIVADRVLGALHIQSDNDSDFGSDVIKTLQNMAGQVAIAIENTRLFQDAQQNIRELRAIQQQYLLTGWSGYTGQPEELEYGVGDESEDARQRLEIPISLRDQILGQIRLEGREEWTREQQLLVDAVATQAAIALENARLVHETRQVAVRERMLAEINSKVWASATIDGVLQTVVKELGRRLDASQATIELKLDEPH